MANTAKPSHLKFVQGTARGDRTNPNEPEIEPEIPSCPPSLSSSAKSEWRRVAPLLEAQGLLCLLDRSALAAYCELYARWVKALNEIKKGGEVVTTPNGSLQVSPWLSIARSAEKELRTYAGLFGMSPADRRKVDSKKKAPEKPEGKGRFFK